MHEKQTTISVKLGMKAAHHHLGVLPSTIPAIASEIHPRLRWFETSGIRSSSAGVCGTIGMSLISCSAISELPSVPQDQDAVRDHEHGWYGHPVPFHTRRYSTAFRRNPASSDLDFGAAPDRSGGVVCPGIPTRYNRALAF